MKSKLLTIVTVLFIVCSCATKRRVCSRENELLRAIRAADKVDEIEQLESKIGEKSDIYLLHAFHLKRAELATDKRLRMAYKEYAAELQERYPTLSRCPEGQNE